MAKPESKSSADYWREREEEQRKHNIQEEKAYSQEIERIYRQMMNEIEIQINNFYTRYATKEGITYAEAKKRVSKLDIKTYAELAKKYVAEKNFSDQANEEMRLYNLTMKVNRLELLKANIGMHLVGGFDELQRFFEEKLTKRTIETFKRQAGILGRTVHDNARYAHSIVNASFHSATWSDRIWKHQDTLRNELGSLLSTGLIQGRNPRELARTLRKKIKSSVYDANRLMITEMARVQTEAQRRSFEENGFDQYTFHSLGTACPHCLAINGNHFNIKDMQPGVNAPPRHPNCRCSTSAYIERTDFGVSDEEVILFDEWTETYDKHGLSWRDCNSEREKWKKEVDLHQLTLLQWIKEVRSPSYFIEFNKQALLNIKGEIREDKIIITGEQKRHILERHPEAYKLVMGELCTALKDPDYILADKKENTGKILKRFESEGKYILAVLRLNNDEDHPDFLSSIITCWMMSERKTSKIIKKAEILYSKK